MSITCWFEVLMKLRSREIPGEMYISCIFTVFLSFWSVIFLISKIDRTSAAGPGGQLS